MYKNKKAKFQEETKNQIRRFWVERERNVLHLKRAALIKMTIKLKQ